MFTHRTQGEVGYIEASRSIRSERLDAWRRASLIDPSMWVWDRARLRVAFRYLRNNGP